MMIALESELLPAQGLSTFSAPGLARSVTLKLSLLSMSDSESESVRVTVSVQLEVRQQTVMWSASGTSCGLEHMKHHRSQPEAESRVKPESITAESESALRTVTTVTSHDTRAPHRDTHRD